VQPANNKSEDAKSEMGKADSGSVFFGLLRHEFDPDAKIKAPTLGSFSEASALFSPGPHYKTRGTFATSPRLL
jgi:hypothetical protein